MPTLEVCVDNFESVKATVNGGGIRIELCSSLRDGGLTPSVGFLKHVKRVYPQLTVFVMIRPRGGDFCYCPDELQIMLQDIELLKEAQADGFVFGCLLPDGSVDKVANRQLLEKAYPLPVTFHRAFDMVKQMEQSLETVIDLGFKRILISGQRKNAFQGVEQIKKMIQLAAGRIIIMPGAGINVNNLDDILKQTKASEFHSSASGKRESSMKYRNEQINMGSQLSQSDEYSWKISLEETVRELIHIAAKY